MGAGVAGAGVVVSPPEFSAGGVVGVVLPSEPASGVGVAAGVSVTGALGSVPASGVGVGVTVGTGVGSGVGGT